jgi:hypothetical protein
MTSLNSNHVPCNWKEAMHDPKWRKVMFEEMRTLVKNDTWDMVLRLTDRNTVGASGYIQLSILLKEMLKD